MFTITIVFVAVAVVVVVILFLLLLFSLLLKSRAYHVVSDSHESVTLFIAVKLLLVKSVRTRPIKRKKNLIPVF